MLYLSKKFFHTYRELANIIFFIPCIFWLDVKTLLKGENITILTLTVPYYVSSKQIVLFYAAVRIEPLKFRQNVQTTMSRLVYLKNGVFFALCFSVWETFKPPDGITLQWRTVCF